MRKQWQKESLFLIKIPKYTVDLMPTFYHNGAKNKRDAIWAFYKNFVKANFPLILLKAKVFFVKMRYYRRIFKEKEEELMK